MSNRNQFYNSPKFRLIKVRFTPVDVKTYTYVAHVRHKVNVGDWVTVPVGEVEDVFGVTGGYRDIQTVEVTAITDDMRHLPKGYNVKMIISNLKYAGDNYQVLYKRKMNLK